ncbi:hypothetical protein CRT60_01370 [Azospirillum palustre]|uniref:Uncharacterized protein n=1 Tax=Azospirillum palustre TaxID=2044885 RepID=A0A2B8BP30_9PROT|nr:sulfotransferase [Azospirillum palustre]PGH59308.1 hypothetical protein CRT60_01370 [Azospirillum palustre]
MGNLPRLSIALAIEAQNEDAASRPLLALTLASLREQIAESELDAEILVAVWGGRADAFGLDREAVWPASLDGLDLRIVTVPDEVIAEYVPESQRHARFSLRALNVAIRRARAPRILCLLPGVVLSPGLLDAVVAGADDELCFSRTAHLPASSLPGWPDAGEGAMHLQGLASALALDGRHHLRRFHETHRDASRRGYLYGAMRMVSARRFMLAPTKVFHTLRGLPEWELRVENLGFMTMFQAFNHGIPVRFLSPDKAHWQVGAGTAKETPDPLDALELCATAADGSRMPLHIGYSARGWPTVNHAIDAFAWLRRNGYFDDVRIERCFAQNGDGGPFDILARGVAGQFPATLQANDADWGLGSLQLPETKPQVHAALKGRSTVRYSGGSTPLPGRKDLEHVLSLPVAQLFATGRSGTTVLHAHLDGHPEVLHIPYAFFFPRLLRAGQERYDPIAACERVLTEHWAAPLFDTAVSPHTGGRLGADCRTVVRVDRRTFRQAVRAIAGSAPMTERELFCTFHLAYAWCLGSDPKSAKVLLHHLHHGDWLFPDRLIETANINPLRSRECAYPFPADSYVVPVRHPVSALISYKHFADAVGHTPEERAELHERYLRLLVQDWVRTDILRRQSTPVLFLQLEAVKRDTPRAVQDLCRHLGIDPTHPALGSMTFYGLPWHGDPYGKPSTGLRAEPSDSQADAVDIAFLLALIGDLAEQQGYPLGCSAFSPELALATVRSSFDVPGPRWGDRVPYAEKHREARIAFAQAIIAQRSALAGGAGLSPIGQNPDPIGSIQSS